MRNNVHNVMSDAFRHVGIREDTFHVEFNIIGEIGHLLITFNPNLFPQGVVIPTNQCLIKVFYEDREEFSTVFLENNDLFKGRSIGRMMDYLTAHPIDLGNA
jgi:hypothetical protein